MKIELTTVHDIGEKLYYVSGDFETDAACGCKPRLFIDGFPYQCQLCFGTGIRSKYKCRIRSCVVKKIYLETRVHDDGDICTDTTYAVAFDDDQEDLSRGIQAILLHKTMQAAAVEAARLEEENAVSRYDEEWLKGDE
jgi:hypothetical protein